MTVIGAQITIQRQPELACVYGLFDNGECLYIGRTSKPLMRIKQHTTRIHRLIGRIPEKRVIAMVHRAQAAETETATIRHYAAIGQAKLNINQKGKK